jgi:hypothetical protein
VPVSGPKQTAPSDTASFHHGNHLITPLANYRIQARVFGAERYRFDTMADLIPVDLALAWGDMAYPGRLKKIHARQSGRFLQYQFSEESMDLSDDKIVCQVANTHCIPATAEIRHTLLEVRPDDVIQASGILVQVVFPGGGIVRSSLSRTDTGPGSCEVFFIRELTIE